ncbi:MAG TPA: Hsp33 family molecular chaperone HslO [bacterium]
MTDRLIRGIFPQHNFRFAVCQTAALCEEAIHRHKADLLSGWLLSEALTCAALTSIHLKAEEKLTLRWMYPGPVGTILVDTTDKGEVRGFPQRLRLLPEIQTVSEAIGGDGRVTAITSLPNRMGHTGITPTVFRDVARDLAYLFSLSFQIETAMAVGLSIPPGDPIAPLSAVGLLLQPMPGADLEAFEEVRKRIEDRGYRDWLETAPRSPEAMVAHLGIAEPPRWLEELEPAYVCFCSREKVEAVLRMLDPAELQDMIDKQGGAEVNCHFCAAGYAFSKHELQSLLRQSQSGHA